MIPGKIKEQNAEGEERGGGSVKRVYEEPTGSCSSKELVYGGDKRSHGDGVEERTFPNLLSVWQTWTE